MTDFLMYASAATGVILAGIAYLEYQRGITLLETIRIRVDEIKARRRPERYVLVPQRRVVSVRSQPQSEGGAVGKQRHAA